MICERYEKSLSAYLNGELDTERIRLFEDHLAGCRECALEFTRFRKIVSMTADLPEIQPSSDFDSSLKAKLANIQPDTSFSFLFGRRIAAYAGAFCFLLIVISGIYLYNTVYQRDKNIQILAGREFVPSVHDRLRENVLTDFIMPSITIKVSATGPRYIDHIQPDFILPSIAEEYLPDDGKSYVLKKVSLTNDTETGLWH